MALIFTHNLLIKTSSKAVFNAVTLPERLNNWWILKGSRILKLDSGYNLNFTDVYNWFGKVSEVKNNGILHLKITDSEFN
ncbi:hypothetical protein Q4Q39_02965 [Flavivirga amylovorans]|uniref:Uncharacterized protein n=1 Tax=Flavivirga amylovorans TaxID=870486 RepID=A0ABT8WXE6_9FLAO|nr:hypothetical protein [Flavivirga amylovorans]MDO5986356.1 hypothetical protein [Flavivirga amylovorans]